MSTDIKIEKNIPVPTRSKIPPLPLGEMEIGDSFRAPVSADNAKEVSSLRQRVARYQRSHPQKRFSVVIDDSDDRHMRVFRIA